MIKVYLKNGEILTFYEAGNILIESSSIGGEAKGILSFNFGERDRYGDWKTRKAAFFVDEIFGFVETLD